MHYELEAPTRIWSGTFVLRSESAILVYHKNNGCRTPVLIACDRHWKCFKKLEPSHQVRLETSTMVRLGRALGLILTANRYLWQIATEVRKQR
jgi:hypothetical protein